MPQGSFLGPVLFLLYINDITDSINSNIRLFADDSILYREIQTPKDHDILQTDLSKLSEWATKWQMNFNIATCHLLRITQKRKPSHFTYTITNQPITQVESHPYLGITIDSKLSWSKHIHTTTSQCARTLGLLKRTLHPATPKVKETAYNLLIRPKLEYAIVAWNTYKQNNIDILEKIQRSAARFTLNDHRRKTSTTELINKLGWETLETRRIQHQLTFFYKIKQNLINIKLPQHIITPCSCTRNSNTNKYIQIHARINTYAHSFYPRVIRAWNTLPPEVISIPTLHPFQQALSTIHLVAPAHLTRL